MAFQFIKMSKFLSRAINMKKINNMPISRHTHALRVPDTFANAHHSHLRSLSYAL